MYKCHGVHKGNAAGGLNKHLQAADVAFGAIRDKDVRRLQSHALVQLLTNGLPQRTLALLSSIPALLNGPLTDTLLHRPWTGYSGAMPDQACRALVAHEVACKSGAMPDATDIGSCLPEAYACSREQCCTAQTRQAHREQRLAASKGKCVSAISRHAHTAQARQVLKEYVADCLITGMPMKNRTKGIEAV